MRSLARAFSASPPSRARLLRSHCSQGQSAPVNNGQASYRCMARRPFPSVAAGRLRPKAYLFPAACRRAGLPRGFPLAPEVFARETKSLVATSSARSWTRLGWDPSAAKSSPLHLRQTSKWQYSRRYSLAWRLPLTRVLSPNATAQCIVFSQRSCRAPHHF